MQDGIVIQKYKSRYDGDPKSRPAVSGPSRQYCKSLGTAPVSGAVPR